MKGRASDMPARTFGRGWPAWRAALAWVRTPRVQLAGQAGLLVLCLWPVVRQVAQEWSSVGTYASQLAAPALIASGLLLVLASLFLPAGMALFMRGAARRVGYAHSAIAYYASQPLKYLPGSFWILPGRVALLLRLGHTPAVAAAGLAFEMTTQVISNALVAVVILGLAGFASVGGLGLAWLILAGSLAASLFLLVSPALLQRLLARPSALRQSVALLSAIPLRARLRNLLLAVTSFSIMWLVMGVSFYLLLMDGSPRLDPALLRLAIGVSTLAWLLGFLAPFSPGGLGVREAAILLLLQGVVPSGQAALVALLSRALALVVEMAFAAVAWRELRSAGSRIALPSPPASRLDTPVCRLHSA